jgi:hypothetical protein
MAAQGASHLWGKYIICTCVAWHLTSVPDLYYRESIMRLLWLFMILLYSLYFNAVLDHILFFLLSFSYLYFNMFKNLEFGRWDQPMRFQHMSNKGLGWDKMPNLSQIANKIWSETKLAYKLVYTDRKGPWWFWIKVNIHGLFRAYLLESGFKWIYTEMSVNIYFEPESQRCIYGIALPFSISVW